MTQVSQVMTRGVRTLSPRDSMQLAAQAMDELNIGAVPVCDGDRLVGIVTDRDITVRGVAHGRPADRTPLSEVMTREVCWCYEDQPVEEVAEEMEEIQIRRLPVVDREKHLVGMVSLGDVAVKCEHEAAQDALTGISEPAEPDRSGTSAASGPAGGGSSSGLPSRQRG
jgi:CBS domain-containing protein